MARPAANADVICSLQLFLYFGPIPLVADSWVSLDASESRESAGCRCLACVPGRRQRRGGRRAQKSW